MSEETEQVQLEARIAAYIDGELPEDQAARLEVYLANTDPKLAERVLGMMHDRNMIRTLPKGRAPADLASRIMEQVERSSLLHDMDHLAMPKRGWWQSRLSIAAAVTILIGGFGYLVVQSVSRPKDAVLPTIAKIQKKPSGIEPERAVEDRDRDRVAKAGPSKDGPIGPIASGAMKPSYDANSVGGALPAGAPREVMSKGYIGKGGSETLALLETMAKDKTAVEGAAEIIREENVQNTLVMNQKLLQDGGSPPANYVSAENATKALARMAKTGSMATKDPIVVTIVARDGQDVTRLKNSINEFMQDPAVAQRQFAVNERVRGINAYANQINANGQVFGNNPGNIINNSGIVSNTSTSPASQVGNSGWNGNNDYLVYNNGKFDQVQISNVARAEQAKLAVQPGPLYRVALKEEQLQQITSTFDVYSVSCGGQSYLISDARRAVKPSGDPRDEEKNGEKTPTLTVAPPASPATPAPSATAPTTGTKEQAGKTEQGDPSGRQQADVQQQRADNNRLVECVIKMEFRAADQRQMQQNVAPNATK